MPTAFLLGSATLVLYLWLKHTQVGITRHDIAQAIRAFTAVFGSMAATGLAIGGRYGLAAVALLATVAALRSLLQAWRGAAPFGGTTRETTTETAYLHMKIDHDTGDIDGQIKAGVFEGVLLSLLSQAQLMELRDEIRSQDAQSLPLLDAFLDHYYSDWRGDGEPPDDGFDQPLSEAKALEILGIAENATIDEIKKAHRSLMSKVHPDHGGSSHLAAQVNAAKELLLRQRGA